MSDLSHFKMIFGCGMLGILQAGIIYVLYLNEVLIDEYIISSITISEVMAIVILLWMFIGVFVALWN